MKTIIYTLLFSLLFVSCEKDYIYIKKIRLKGQISAASSAPDAAMKSPASGFTLADAAKVLIFFGNEYDLVDIHGNGTFSGRAPIGSASCIVFLTADYEFIGNLYVGGCNLLPLVGMDKETVEIDFTTLTLSGTRVIPAHDPIGTTIVLSDKELAFLNQIDSYYEALAKNIDMDNNGKPDVMENKRIQLYSMHSFEGGVWATDTSNADITPKSEITLQNGIHMVGPNELLTNTENSVAENSTLSGPADNPHTDIYNAGNSYINNKEFKVNFARNSNHQAYMSSPFNDGLYTFNIDNKNFTFNYVNVDMLDYLIMAIPTLKVNAANQLTSLSVNYQLSDGSTVSPRNLMSSGVDVNVTSIPPTGGEYQMIEVRSSANAKYDDTYDYFSITFEEPIDMRYIANVSLRYFDMLGNEYSVNWKKEK